LTRVLEWQNNPEASLKTLVGVSEVQFEPRITGVGGLHTLEQSSTRKPDEKDTERKSMPPNNNLENRLWAAADQLRANSSLTAQQYSHPVLGLIFLKFADHRFTAVEREFKEKKAGGRRTIGKLDYQAKGVMFLPQQSRFSYLINLPRFRDRLRQHIGG